MRCGSISSFPADPQTFRPPAHDRVGVLAPDFPHRRFVAVQPNCSSGEPPCLPASLFLDGFEIMKRGDCVKFASLDGSGPKRVRFSSTACRRTSVVRQSHATRAQNRLPFPSFSFRESGDFKGLHDNWSQKKISEPFFPQCSGPP
jgi:hypothetical protein